MPPKKEGRAAPKKGGEVHNRVPTAAKVKAANLLDSLDGESRRKEVSGGINRTVVDIVKKSLYDSFRTWSHEQIHVHVAGDPPMTLAERIEKDIRARMEKSLDAVPMGKFYYDSLRLEYAAPSTQAKVLKVVNPAEAFLCHDLRRVWKVLLARRSLSMLLRVCSRVPRR